MQNENHNRDHRSRLLFAAGLLLIGLSIFIFVWGLKANKKDPQSANQATASQAQSTAGAGIGAINEEPRRLGTMVLRDAVGIEISSLYLSVGGTRVDLRYKVVDSEKANRLTNQLYRAILIAANGQSLSIPNTPTGAPIRAESGSQLTGGRTYSYFFPNPNNVVKSGDTVTLQIGNLRAEQLVVQ